MNGLRFEFGIGPVRDTRALRVGGVAAVLAALVAVGLWFSVWQEHARLSAALEHTRNNLSSLSRADHTPPPSAAMARALGVLALPLPTLLRSLHPPLASNPSVGVVGLELAIASGVSSAPTPTPPRIRLTVHADSLTAAADYLAYLSALPTARAVQMVRHEFVTERGSTYVLAVIELNWIAHEAT